MNSSSSPHSDRRDEPTDERGEMEGASPGNERAWKDGQMEGKKGSRLVHKGRGEAARRLAGSNRLGPMAPTSSPAPTHSSSGLHQHHRSGLAWRRTPTPANQQPQPKPRPAQPAGPVSPVTSSLGVWTAAAGRFRLRILGPSEPVWSDTSIHHRQEERREEFKEERRTLGERQAAGLISSIHQRQTGQLHLIAKTSVCSTHSFHVGSNSVSELSIVNIRARDGVGRARGAASTANDVPSVWDSERAR